METKRKTQSGDDKYAAVFLNRVDLSDFSYSYKREFPDVSAFGDVGSCTQRCIQRRRVKAYRTLVDRAESVYTRLSQAEREMADLVEKRVILILKSYPYTEFRDLSPLYSGIACLVSGVYDLNKRPIDVPLNNFNGCNINGWNLKIANYVYYYKICPSEDEMAIYDMICVYNRVVKLQREYDGLVQEIYTRAVHFSAQASQGTQNSQVAWLQMLTIALATALGVILALQSPHPWMYATVALVCYIYLIVETRQLNTRGLATAKRKMNMQAC